MTAIATLLGSATARCIALLIGGGSCAAACSADSVHPSQFAEGELAQVGEAGIGEAEVRSVAEARRLSAPDALELIVADELFAAEFRQRHAPFLPSLVSAVLARALLRQFQQEAKAEGEVSEQELAELVERNWWKVNRPETVRVSHAVVLVRSPEESGAARELAAELKKVAAEAKTNEEFLRLMEAADKRGQDVRVESLAPVARDGRVLDLAHPPAPGAPIPRYASAFAEAASDIPGVGEISPVVQTDFGFHVLFLVERIPGLSVPTEERKQLLHAEALVDRARRMEALALAAARRENPVQVSRAADSITEGALRKQ